MALYFVITAVFAFLSGFAAMGKGGVFTEKRKFFIMIASLASLVVNSIILAIKFSLMNIAFQIVVYYISARLGAYVFGLLYTPGR